MGAAAVREQFDSFLSLMPYKDAWPLIRSGRYKPASGLKCPPPVHFTEEQRKEYERLVAEFKGKGIFR